MQTQEVMWHGSYQSKDGEDSTVSECRKPAYCIYHQNDQWHHILIVTWRTYEEIIMSQIMPNTKKYKGVKDLKKMSHYSIPLELHLHINFKKNNRITATCTYLCLCCNLQIKLQRVISTSKKLWKWNKSLNEYSMHRPNRNVFGFCDIMLSFVTVVLCYM